MLKYELDQSLISRFYQNRDFNALEEFIRRHRDWAVRHAARYSRDSAEDIVQTSILRLIKTVPTQLPIERPIGWWRKIIVATAIDYLRSEKQRKQRESRSAEPQFEGSMDASDLEANVSLHQQLELIRSEISCMKSDFREPIALHYVEGLTYREIAKLLGIRLGTVSSRIHRGIQQIHNKFELRSQSALPSIYSQPESPKEDKEVHTLNESVVNENQQFAKKWESLWFVSGRSMGRVTSRIDANGHVTVNWREDYPDTVPADDKGFPERARSRQWSETEVFLTDVQSFSWTRLTAEFGATGKSQGELGADECEFTPISDSRIKVVSSKWGESFLDAPGEGPLVMNPQLPLVLFGANRKVETRWSLRLLGRYKDDQSSPAKLNWLALPVTVKCGGRMGEPMKMGHLFEFANLQGEVGQEVSIWESSDNEFAGAFWPEEGLLFTKSEAMARAMVVATCQ